MILVFARTQIFQPETGRLFNGVTALKAGQSCERLCGYTVGSTGDVGE